jgi:hypothetical protein
VIARSYLAILIFLFKQSYEASDVKLFSFLLLFSTLFFLIYKLLISLLSACFVQHFNSCLANKKLLLGRLNWAFLIKTDFANIYDNCYSPPSLLRASKFSKLSLKVSIGR